MPANVPSKIAFLDGEISGRASQPACACSIQDCGKRHYSKGFCRAHYMRWREHGDPLGGRTAEGEPMRFIEDVVIPHRGEECLLWPYGKVKGYGKVRVDGKDTLANRYVCERTHGAPPKPEHQAAHSCGNRACVNPSHLGWKTQSENEGDKLVHGTHSRGDRSARAKLTECQAREVISLRGVKFQREIAATFGVTRAAISMIHRGINWGWIDEDVS